MQQLIENTRIITNENSIPMKSLKFTNNFQLTKLMHLGPILW